MKLLLLPLLAMTFTGCAVQQVNHAMDRNRVAIQRSTQAIERNVEALEQVTQNLKKMQEQA